MDRPQDQESKGKAHPNPMDQEPDEVEATPWLPPQRRESEEPTPAGRSNPWQGKLLATDDRDLLKKGLRSSSAYQFLRILSIGLTVVAALTLLLRLVGWLSMLGKTGDLSNILMDLAELLVIPLLLLAVAGVLRWLADQGDMKMEELADRLKNRS